MLWLVNIVAYIINAVVVGSSQFGWLGATNEEISDDNLTFVTPAGWAFSIWGVIFLFELIFVVWGALPSNRGMRIIDDGVGCWFAIANVVQAAWSLTFAQELLIVSAVLLCAIAFSLGMAVVCLSKFKRAQTIQCLSVAFWTVHFPIGLHAGWVLAASLVNINVALELDDLSSQTAALILTIVGASFGASFAALLFYDQVYLLAVAWAIAGIAAKDDFRRERLGKPISDGVNEALKGLWIALLCLMVLGFLAGVRQRNRDALELEDKSGSSRKREAAASSDLTSAIYAS